MARYREFQGALYSLAAPTSEPPGFKAFLADKTTKYNLDYLYIYSSGTDNETGGALHESEPEDVEEHGLTAFELFSTLDGLGSAGDWTVESYDGDPDIMFNGNGITVLGDEYHEEEVDTYYEGKITRVDDKPITTEEYELFDYGIRYSPSSLYRQNKKFEIPESIRVKGTVYRLALKVTNYDEGAKLFGQMVQQIAEKAKAKAGKAGKDPEDGVVIDSLNQLGAEVGKAVQVVLPKYQQLKDPARKKQLGELVKTSLLGSVTKLLEEYKSKAEGGGPVGDLYSELQTMLPRFTKLLTDKAADAPAKAAKYIQDLQAKYGKGVSADPADPIYPRLGKLVEIATQMSKLKA